MNTVLNSNYFPRLIQEILLSLFNDYDDNYDPYRFGKKEESQTYKGTKLVRKAIRENLNKNGYFNIQDINEMAINKFENASWVNYFSFLYDKLEDEESKNLLIKIVAYRLLGHRKVKLPLNTNTFWKELEIIENKLDKENYIDVEFMNFRLHYSDLSFLNIPLKLFYTEMGLYIDFFIKQYELHRPQVYIGAQEGEVVLDGGGCYGDTALYFANKVGTEGAVHTFEFIPDNIKIFKTNVELNPDFSSQIKLVRRPLWSSSNVEVYYKSNGPGSKVEFEKFEGFDDIVKTISIDDYIEENSLNKLDFIKLDIEGAELQALKGATNTIKEFKPKLAIALYHDVKDFYEIPKFLDELNLGYKFYLLHATIHAEETMLFAIIN